MFRDSCYCRHKTEIWVSVLENVSGEKYIIMSSIATIKLLTVIQYIFDGHH